MNRVCFYSDDSYSPIGGGKRHVVIAGAALCLDRGDIRNLLLEAEKRSGKGAIRDWHKSDASVRERYIDAVLDISFLRGRIFYLPLDSVYPSDFWEARVKTISKAIDMFTTGNGNCYHEVYPEGLPSGDRFTLRQVLRRRGYKDVAVEASKSTMSPEVRLSDALAGYLRTELYRGDGIRAPLTNIPDWFLNLEA